MDIKSTAFKIIQVRQELYNIQPQLNTQAQTLQAIKEPHKELRYLILTQELANLIKEVPLELRREMWSYIPDFPPKV